MLPTSETDPRPQTIPENPAVDVDMQASESTRLTEEIMNIKNVMLPEQEKLKMHAQAILNERKHLLSVLKLEKKALCSVKRSEVRSE